MARVLTCAAALTVLVGSALTANAQWLPNFRSYSIERIGLFAPQHTGSGGLQFSDARLFNAPGFIAGTSNRYSGVSTNNGVDAWVWNGTATTQIGLTGAGYTGSAGFQVSVPERQNAAGQVTGTSRRIIDVSTNFGEDTWVWNGTTTTQIGLIGADYTGSSGFRFSSPERQNAAGQVAGTSRRISGVSTSNGTDTWVWNGTTTTQIGLTGAGYTGSAGFQVSLPTFQNDAGQVVGSSQRFTGVDTENGQDAWVWNGTTTTQIGLTGAGYTGSTGRQFSLARLQNSTGQVAGTSDRLTGVSTANGQDAWIWNGTATTQIGLTGAGYTGSAGFQYSLPTLQNAAGQVVGLSRRITGVSRANGSDAWVWNGTTTTQIGLTGGVYVGSQGFQDCNIRFQSDAGQVVGYSRRISGVSTSNGTDTWVWNGTTTTQIGLTGAGYTGSAGYQFSFPQFQNAAGQVVGISYRVSGVKTGIGSDTWFYDPLTGVTSAVIGSVRTADNYAYSEPTILTEGGFLLGNYLFYPGGAGNGEQRAFIFRPDLGLTDLGNLVSGGLTLNGWSTLQKPLFSDALRTIVGYGYVNGQTSGQSVFVLVPSPSAVVLFGGGGLFAARRRRRQLACIA